MAYAGAIFAIVAAGWSGPVVFVALVVLNVALGLAVGRWWAALVPFAVWAIAIPVWSEPSGDLNGADLEAVAVLAYGAVGAALVAVGVLARRLRR